MTPDDTIQAPSTAPLSTPDDRVRRLEARLERERCARREAERLLETKSLELYEANQALSALAADLEARVEARTHELSIERQRALNMAETDSLTGIANRASFARRLGEALADRRATNRGVAVLLIDLDDFKLVNDTMGHAAGDLLLIEFARRLATTVRPGDIVARLGGDEFAIVARSGLHRHSALVMARRLLRKLQRPVAIEGRNVPCSCSIGVAESDLAAGNADDLLRDADLALYAAKRAGRARIVAFEPSLRHDVERRTALDAEIRQAVLGDQFRPWYQPIVDRSSGRAIGVEVLARWHAGNADVRSPAAFLPTVEGLGLLDAMMDNIVRRALAETRPAVESGALDYVSINVSPSQFNQGWALERLPALLAEAGFPAQALMVEITENALLHDLDSTHAMLDALTASGMRIALDDFGVGYSNFSLLRRLPFALLKLDRSLICDIETDAHALALAECILDLAARLEIKVVAEGVETRRQTELLAAGGCAAMQGYWFARPQRDASVWSTVDAGEAAFPPC